MIIPPTRGQIWPLGLPLGGSIRTIIIYSSPTPSAEFSITPIEMGASTGQTFLLPPVGQIQISEPSGGLEFTISNINLLN
jgi:hypothetical protein